MGFEVNNKAAEKWDENAVIIVLEEILKICINNPKVRYIVTPLQMKGLYKQKWSEWKHKFAENERVSEFIMRIESVLESKLIEGAIDGDYNPTISGLIMRAKYGFQEPKEREEDDIKKTVTVQLPNELSEE